MLKLKCQNSTKTPKIFLESRDCKVVSFFPTFFWKWKKHAGTEGVNQGAW